MGILQAPKRITGHLREKKGKIPTARHKSASNRVYNSPMTRARSKTESRQEKVVRIISASKRQQATTSHQEPKRFSYPHRTAENRVYNSPVRARCSNILSGREAAAPCESSVGYSMFEARCSPVWSLGFGASLGLALGYWCFPLSHRTQPHKFIQFVHLYAPACSCVHQRAAN